VSAITVVLDEICAAHVCPSGHQQLVCGETGDDVAAARCDDDLFLDPRRGAPIGRRAVRLEREHHSFLELDGMLEGVDARDHGRLVEADADAVAELKAEAGFLVGKAELLRRRPDLRDPVRRHPGSNELDRRVEPLTALLVGIEL
jgi:hypothetical protein